MIFSHSGLHSDLYQLHKGIISEHNLKLFLQMKKVTVLIRNTIGMLNNSERNGLQPAVSKSI